MDFKNATKKTWIYKDLVYIKPLSLLRKTPSVEFYNVTDVIKGLGAIDKVVHSKGAISPNIKGHKGERPWYMHNYQEDNLLVHEGKRLIDLYSKKHGKIESFEVTSNYVKHRGKIIYKGECIVGWPKFVYHRIQSPNGSISTNYAKHMKGFDIRTNFNIYELDVKTGKHVILRHGHLDQPKHNKKK